MAMHSRRTLLVLLIGSTLAVAVTALALFGIGPRSDSDAAPTRLATTGRAGATHSALEDAPVAPAQDRSPTESALAPAVDASTARAPDGRLLAVSIVRADTGAPAPGATVWFWPRAASIDGDDGFEGWLRRSEIDEHLGAAGQLRADAEGRVRVPDDELGFVAAAQLDDQWGYASFPAARGDQRATVAIAPDRDVRVQIVDSTGGAVAGAPVALRTHELGANRDCLSARTRAPEGIAVLRHAGLALRTRSGGEAGVVIALQGMLDPPLERALDSASSEMVTLVLPATGSCEVSVVDEHGEPVIGALEARLGFADAGVGDARTDSDTPAESIHSRSCASVVFEYVQLGRTLAVSVRREGSNAPLEARGPGPSKPGERTQLRVHISPDVALLRGRLIESNGAPCANLRARACLEAGDPARRIEGAWSLQTAADGRFTVETASMPDDDAVMTLAVFRLSERGEEIAVARRPLASGLTAGSQDLGDFALTEIPIVAAGVVVDRDGNSIAGAAVTLTTLIAGRAEENDTPSHDRSIGPIRSDAHGRFEMRGDLGARDVALVAEEQGLVGEPVIVRTGERNARVVLGPAGTIEGTVLLDPSLLDSMVLVQVARGETTPAEHAAAETKPGVIARDGRFAVLGLRPGTYSAKVVYAATGSELGVLEGLVVESAAVSRDPRLDPLDLRAAARLIALEPVDELGQPILGARAFSRRSGDINARWLYAAAEQGRLKLLSDGRALDVTLSAVGFLRSELEAVDASRRVTLRRAADLRLELEAGARVPDPPLYLGVRLTPREAGRSSSFTDSPMAYFDERGVISCQSSFTGDLALEGFLTLRDGNASATVLVHADAPRGLYVEARAGEQVFAIHFDPAELEAAVRSLRAEH